MEDLRIDRKSQVWNDLLEATAVSTVSPARADADDYVYDRRRIVADEAFRIVVRKPTSSGPVVNVSGLSNDPEEAWRQLRHQLYEASRIGASVVRFPAGADIHLANASKGGPHLVIDGFTDTVFDLNGSTLHFDQMAPGIAISDSRRVVVRNGSLKSGELLASVAQVEAHASSPTGIRLRVLPAYLNRLDAQRPNTDAEPALHTVGQVKRDAGRWVIDACGNRDLFTNRGGALDQFAWVVSSRGDERAAWYEPRSGSARGHAPFPPGQYVYLLHRNNDAHGIVLKNHNADLEDISFEDLDLVNIPGMAIYGEVNRGIHLNRVSIVPDASDPLSMWGSSSDAFHINNHGGDVVVEESDFGASADDLVTAKGNWWIVEAIDRSTGSVTVGNAGKRHYNAHLWGERGHRFVAVDDDMHVVGESVQRARSDALSGNTHVVHLDTVPRALRVGSLVANPDLAGGRMLVRGNRFSNTRAHAVLAKAPHIIIEDNEFTNTAAPGIEFRFSPVGWHEGVATGNAIVRDNLFRNTGVGLDKRQRPVHVHQTDRNRGEIDVFDDLLLERNRQMPDDTCAP